MDGVPPLKAIRLADIKDGSAWQKSLQNERLIGQTDAAILAAAQRSGNLSWANRVGPSPFAHGLAGYWDVQDLRPGITGYWQISGRSEVGYAERVRLDLAYVKGWSLKLDSMILAKTLRALVSSRGAY